MTDAPLPQEPIYEQFTCDRGEGDHDELFVKIDDYTSLREHALTLRRRVDELEADNADMEMTCRKAFYKLSRGMAVSQETMGALQKYGTRNASALRGGSHAD